MNRSIDAVLCEMRPDECVCVIKNKRRSPNRNGMFICEARCVACGHEQTLTFGGWVASSCLQCERMMWRLPYMKKPVYEAIFGHGFDQGVMFALETMAVDDVG